MKIMLIALPTKNIGNQFPNLGAIAIAQTVRDLGHDVHLIDTVRYNYSKEEIVSEISRIKPDLIGLSGLITSYYYFEPLVAAVKKSFPKIPLIVGGSITSAIDLIEKYTEVDYVVKGEGEDCISELLSRLSSARSLDVSGIPGLFAREEGKFTHPTAEQSYPDLSKIPIPAYDLYDLDYYIDSSTKNVYRSLKIYPEIRKKIGEDVRFFPIVISRGCPFSCLFCYRLIKKHRHPPVDKTIRHLRMIKEELRCSGITLLDELIIVDKKWFIELCDAIARELPGLKIFSGAGRVDLVTPEIISHAKKAGFIRFGCGIESGSQVILNNLNKKTTVQQNLDAIKLIKESGIMATCNLLFGGPGESKESLGETERFIRENLDPRDYAVNFAYAYPGAPLFDYAVDEGILKPGHIHDYVLNANFGDYPLNFSKFNSADKLYKEVGSMQFRLKVHSLWEGREYKSLAAAIARHLVLEVLYLLSKISPRMIGAIRSINDKRRLKMFRAKLDVKK